MLIQSKQEQLNDSKSIKSVWYVATTYNQLCEISKGHTGGLWISFIYKNNLTRWLDIMRSILNERFSFKTLKM